MKTPLELINETELAYSQPDTRARNAILGCVYLDTLTGNRCAVGRCMTPGPWQELEGDFDSLLKRCNPADFLLPEYQEIPEQLWRDLQSWHDSGFNFTATGISPLGLQRINNLKLQYK